MDGKPRGKMASTERDEKGLAGDPMRQSKYIYKNERLNASRGELGGVLSREDRSGAGAGREPQRCRERVPVPCGIAGESALRSLTNPLLD